jgi:nuclear inhibitor of protein phosphatase 1
MKMMDTGLVPIHSTFNKHLLPRTSLSLYDDIPPDSGSTFFTTLSSKLDMPLPNPAPDIEATIIEPQPVILPPLFNATPTVTDLDEPKKKKYAKEAWPGRKSGPGNLLI